MKHSLQNIVENIYGVASAISHMDDIKLPEDKLEREDVHRNLTISFNYLTGVIDDNVELLLEQREQIRQGEVPAYTMPSEFTRARLRHMFQITMAIWSGWKDNARPNATYISYLFRCASDLDSWVKNEKPAWSSNHHWGEQA